LAIRTDEYGYELYWEIVDEYGEVHAYGGNLVVAETNGGAQIATDTDPGAYADEIFIIDEIYLPVEGCYQLRVLDDFADGICCNYGNGFYRLRVPGQAPFIEGGEFGALEEKYFSFGFGATSATHEVEANPEPTLFPNPVNSQQSLDIRWTGVPPSSYDWQISNSNGQRLQTGSQDQEPNLSKLVAGYYFFQLRYADKQRILPLVVHR
jgi:predicted secreted protein